MRSISVGDWEGLRAGGWGFSTGFGEDRGIVAVRNRCLSLGSALLVNHINLSIIQCVAIRARYFATHTSSNF